MKSQNYNKIMVSSVESFKFCSASQMVPLTPIAPEKHFSYIIIITIIFLMYVKPYFLL